jgi:hypothetical protein
VHGDEVKRPSDISSCRICHACYTSPDSASELQTVEKRYAKHMQAMMDHVPETDELAIIGKGAADRLYDQAHAPITLLEVLARLELEDPKTSARLTHVKAAHLEAQQKRKRAQEKVRPLRCACKTGLRF